MYKFGEVSLSRIAECHPDLQEILHEAIKVMDVTIIQGHRPKVKQDEYFAIGTSQVQWPHSKHNSRPEAQVARVVARVDRMEKRQEDLFDLVKDIKSATDEHRGARKALHAVYIITMGIITLKFGDIMTLFR